MAKDYTNYDYNSLVERMTDLVKNKPGWGEGYESSSGQTLIQLMADVTDSLHYMLERRSAEAYTVTARLESSIRAAVSSVGYRPRRKISASGTLRLTLVDDAGLPVPAEGNIFLPYGKEITFDDRRFLLARDYTINTGESEIDVNIIQGELNSMTLNFDDEPYSDDLYMEFPDYIDIEEYSLQIVGDKVTYGDVFENDNGLRVRALSFADKTMPVYDLKFVKSGMRVVFGDGIFGMKPEGNVHFSWITSEGGDVSVIKQGLSFAFDSEILLDDQLITPRNEYNYEMTNITPIRGGKDEESVEEMKDNLTAFVRTNDRAVTNFDYEFWVKRSGIGDIVDVKAYGEHETNRLIFTMNNIYITYATDDRLELNPAQILAMREYINRTKIDTTHLVFRPVVPIYLGMDIDFKPHRSLPISTAQLYKILADRIEEYFVIEKGSIGKEFQHSEFVEYLQNLSFDFNTITYPMTDFVKVNATGIVPIELPQPIYDGVLELSNDYVVVPNQVWTVTIDSENFSLVTTSADTVPSLMDKMQEIIFKGTSLMLARPEPNQLRIRHARDEGVYEISTGSGDLVAYTSVKQYVQLPRPNNVVRPNEDQLMPGTISLVDENDNLIMEDDGNGLMVDSTSTYPSVVIDYAECKMEHPSIPARTYYMKFQQNEFQNFMVTRESLVDLMDIKRTGDPDDMHYFSTINILG